MNNATEYIKTPEDRADWLKVRETGVGGSDVAAVIGISPWATPLTVFFDKRKDLAPAGYLEEREARMASNLALSLGNYLEEFAAKEYTERTGRQVRRYGFMVRRGHLIGDVDRLVCPASGLPAHHAEVRTDLGLEIKTSNQFPWDEVPDYYLAQVHTYMALLPMIASFDVAALFKSSSEFRTYRVDRDQETEDAIADMVEEFWAKYVEPGVPPPALTEEDCRLRWAKSRDRAVQASPEVVDAIAAIHSLEAQVKEAEAAISTHKAAVLAAMEDGDTLVDQFGHKLASYKSSKDTERTDWKGMAGQLLEDISHAMIEANFTEYEAGLRGKFTTVKPGPRVFRLGKPAK